MHFIRTLFRPAAVVAASTIAMLGINLSPAGATVVSTLRNGSGAETMVGVLDPPPDVCATYTGLEATLQFSSGTVGTYTGAVTANLKFGTSVLTWGEFADGTYTSTKCKSGTGPGAHIGGFTGTLVGTGLSCTVQGYYDRGQNSTSAFPELNVEFMMNPVSGSCGGVATTNSIRIMTTISHVTDPTDPTGYVSECDSPIAPSACALGPADSAWT